MRPTCLYRLDLWFCLNLDNKVLGMTNMKNLVTINLSPNGYRENLRLKNFSIHIFGAGNPAFPDGCESVY